MRLRQDAPVVPGACQDKSGSARSFGASWATPVAFFAATWTLVSVVRVDATLHLDTARDLLLARDCVLGGVCGAGPRSSFGGWTQGALWSHVLELREMLGLSLSALEEFARLTLALAAALVPLAARSLGRTSNALTWAVWFPATLLTIGYPTLWNPTLLPLALNLFYVAFFHATRTRSSTAFVAAAVTLAFAVDLHVASVLIVPALVGAMLACASRPLVAMPAAAIAAVIVHGVSSPRAFVENWPLVISQAPTVGVGLALAAVGGIAVRRRLSGLDGRMRATMSTAGLCIYMLGLFPLLAFLADHPLHARYLAPLVLPAALLLSTHSSGAAPRVWIRTTGTLFVIVGYLAFAVGEHILNPRFRLSEAERVGSEIYSRGISYGDLYRHLRGPDAVHLLAILAALEPPDLRQSADDSDDLLVLRTTRQQLPRDLPADWIVVELDAKHVAVVVPYTPWLRLESLEVCRKHPATCMGMTLAVVQRADTLWVERSHPTLPEFRRPDRGERVSYRISLRADVGGSARLIHLLQDGCEGWQVELDGASDGTRSVRVEPDGKVHNVVFSVVAWPGCRWWLPPFIEVPEGSAMATLIGGA